MRVQGALSDMYYIEYPYLPYTIILTNNTSEMVRIVSVSTVSIFRTNATFQITQSKGKSMIGYIGPLSAPLPSPSEFLQLQRTHLVLGNNIRDNSQFVHIWNQGPQLQADLLVTRLDAGTNYTLALVIIDHLKNTGSSTNIFLYHFQTTRIYIYIYIYNV